MQASGTAAIGADGLRQGLTPRPMPVGAPSVVALLDMLDGQQGTAIIDRDGAMSYAELLAAVDAAAAGLQARGVAPGKVVAGSAPNCAMLIVAFLATQRLGAIWLGVNRALAPPEKAELLRDSGAGLFLAPADILAQVAGLIGPAVQTLTMASDDGAFEALVAAHKGERPAPTPCDPLAPAIIGYTSGTTGTPKGVVHSQHSMMAFPNACLASDQGGQWRSGLVRALSISLTIMNGMIYGPLAALASRGTYVAIDRGDAGGIGEWVDRHGIQVLNSATPTIRDLLVKQDLQHLSLKSLEAVAVGGGPVDEVVLDAFKARFGFEIIVDYGITESPAGMASSRIERRRKPGFVGVAHPHLALAVMDGDGRELPRGEVGELCAGPRRDGDWAGVYTGMLGYWRKPDETRAAFHGAWLRTGDMAKMDDEGHIAIVGRKKEMILRGGANIYPAEVERVLNANERVMEAVVVGTPDERLGQIVTAYVQLRPNVAVEPGLRGYLDDYCRGQLARYKVPERWFVIDDIPRNAMNKAQKNLISTVPATPLD